MSLKNVKVTEDVKKQLDDMAIEKETYNVTIQRLINENKQLKKNEEKTDTLLEFYEMKTRDMSQLYPANNMLELVIETNGYYTNTHNPALNYLEQINRVLLNQDLTSEEMYDELKEDIEINEDLSKEQIFTVICYAKDYGYDEHKVLPKLEEELNEELYDV